MLPTLRAVPVAVMTKTKTVRTCWYSIGLLTVGHFLSDFYANFLPPLIPVFISNLGLSLTNSGLLVMVYSLTSNVIQPLCGYLIDRSGYAWTILLTILVSAIFICLSPLSSNLVIIFIGVALSGLATSFFHPLGSSLISKIAAPDNQGLALSMFIGGGNVGFALAPAAIIYYLLQYGPSNLPWLIIPAAILTVAFYLAGIHHINLQAPRKKSTESTRSWYKDSDLIKLNIVMALRSCAQVSLLTFLPVLLATKGAAPILAGNMLTLFLMGGALGSFVGGYIGDKLGHKNFVIYSLAICIPSMYLFLTSNSFTWLGWLFLILSGTTLQSTVPSSIVWAQRILPNNAAMTSGMMLGLSFGLGGAGAALTGAVADYIGLNAALLWSILPLVVAIPIAYWIPYGGNSKLSNAKDTSSS